MRNFVLSALCSTLIPGGAIAQDSVPLEVISTKVTRLDQLESTSSDVGLACCAREVLMSGPDQDFIYLHIRFDVGWSDEIKRVSYSGSQTIRLKQPGETDPAKFLSPWGTLDWYPDVRLFPPSINGSRPSRWPDKDIDVFLDGVWTVPDSWREAVLVVGKDGQPQAEFPLDLSVPMSSFEPSGSLWNVEPKAISTVDSINTKREDAFTSLGGKITPSVGQIVKLEMVLMPQRDLKVDRTNDVSAATFETEHIALVGPEGLPLALVGQALHSSRKQTVRNSTSTTVSWSGDAQRKSEITVYFLGSGAPGDYRVFFKEVEVGSITLK